MALPFVIFRCFALTAVTFREVPSFLPSSLLSRLISAISAIVFASLRSNCPLKSFKLGY